MNIRSKVLVLSRGFFAGDAITTINLFSKWPKNQLFGASLSSSEYISAFDEFYLLGDEEVCFKFPFKYLYTPPKSECSNGWNDFAINKKPKKQTLFHKMYEHVVRPTLQYFDLYETRFTINLSNSFIEWIEKISPDVIYTSVGDIPMADFLLKVKKRFPNINIIIHNFDDWTYPVYPILYNRRHRQKREEILKQVFDISSGLFTSSVKMAEDYEKKYGLKFRSFPNPVNINPGRNKDEKKTKKNIVFTGKIGWHNNDAIKTMIATVDGMNRLGDEIVFDIYTDTDKRHIKYFLGSFSDSTCIHQAVPNERIMNILSSASLLFLPINLDKKTKNFTKYSMSTKMGEYLASGVCTIYYAPEEIAMTEFVKDKDCVIHVDSPQISVLEKSIRKGLDDDSSELSNIAQNVAKQYFDREKISIEFAKAINQSIVDAPQA